jgi:hypothetical protein
LQGLFVHEIAIASVAPLDEAGSILGPPYQDTSGQRPVLGESFDRLGNLLDRQQSGWHAPFDTLSGCQ